MSPLRRPPELGHHEHADSWDGLRPPCGQCAPIVARFPGATPNPDWRKIVPQERRHPAHPAMLWGTFTGRTEEM